MAKIRENTKKPVIETLVSFKPYPEIPDLEKSIAQIEEPENGPEIIKLCGKDISAAWQKI